LVRDRKGEFSTLFSNLKAKGYRQIRLDGLIKSLDEDLYLIKTNKHSIEAVIDKLSLSDKNLKDPSFTANLNSRLTEAVSQGLNLSQGNLILAEIKDPGFEIPEYPKKWMTTFFRTFACPVDNIQIPEIEPRTFSFNSPHGACPTCGGLGKCLK